MRCLACVLSWVVGVPCILAAACALVGGWYFVCDRAATALGYPDPAGFTVAIATVFMGIGAVFGVLQCRGAA